MIDMQKKFNLKSDVVFQPMDENAIIVSLNSEDIYKLNETGTQIVELIAKEKSFQEIIQHLEETYQIERDELAKEIDDLLNDLLSANLIEETV